MLTTLLSTKQTAARLGLEPQTLRKWRWAGIGLRYVRISATRCAYAEDEIERFIAARSFSSTSEASASRAA